MFGFVSTGSDDPSFACFFRLRRHATHQVKNDFTVRVRLELVVLLELAAEGQVVVDLAVDGEDDTVVGRGERLGARV